MITDEGKVYIKRYLAGWTPNIASSMAYGVGDRTEFAAEKRLHFEAGRVDIALTSYDFNTNKLIFKAQLPEELDVNIHEVALYSQEKNSLAGDYGSVTLLNFTSEDEDWIDPVTGASRTYNSLYNRIGTDTLRLNAPANSNLRGVLEGVEMDFSGNTSADKFILAANYNANVTSVNVIFKNDSANYYTVTFPAETGYKIKVQSMASAVATGTPDWSDITSVEVKANAGAGGSGIVDLDGLRIEDTDSPNPEYVMVARELLGTPFVKEEGRIQSIEFAISVTI